MVQERTREPVQGKRIWSTEEEIKPAVWSDQRALAQETTKLENQQREGSRGNEINNRTQ
jgi:hypothetical protein